MKIKETYTRGEADFMSIMSAVIGQNPHTFQGNSAYWDLVEIDFETKTVTFTVFSENEPVNLCYLYKKIKNYEVTTINTCPSLFRE